MLKSNMKIFYERRLKKMLKKGDFIIILSVLLLALISSVLAFSQKSGKTVTVKENNKTVYSGSLYENKTIKLAGNTVEIKNGKVRVSSADCKNQICVNHKPISKRGESIICLPNKVLAEVE